MQDRTGQDMTNPTAQGKTIYIMGSDPREEIGGQKNY